MKVKELIEELLKMDKEKIISFKTPEKLQHGVEYVYEDEKTGCVVLEDGSVW